MFAICKSSYSLGWGVSSPKALCRQAKKLGYSRLCITDINNLYGLPEFMAAAKQYQITPLIGAEITNGRQAIICLVQTQQGYSNLCRIISCRHCHPHFDFQHIFKPRHHGILALGSDMNLLLSLRQIGMEPIFDLGLVAQMAQEHLSQQAKHHSLACTTIQHCTTATLEEQRTHLLLRVLHQKKTIQHLTDATNPNPMCPPAPTLPSCPPHHHLSLQQISAKCPFSGPARDLIMPPYSSSHSARQTLRHRALKGAAKRYPSPLTNMVHQRLRYELDIIDTMGFSAYFLVVQDIVCRKGKENKYRRICGRGSGAASLVAYCLHITNVCPIKYNLYFERFLHLGRMDPPDIDIDFAWDERQDVLQEIFARYPRRAAMVCNHVFYQPRMTIREVAKAYGLPESEIKVVTSRIHGLNPQADLLPQLKQSIHLQNYIFSAPWPDILKDAQRIIGLPRHLSVHPGGIIITPKPISHYVPIQYSGGRVPIIHWDKDGAEFFGLVKIDILGNRSLGVIRDTIKQIEASGNRFNETDWHPEEDPATQHLIKRGGTMGCFYIESPAMRLLQKKAGSGDFEQLIIQSSIIRPAANEFVREYVRRLHGGTWSHLHPCLKEVLDESFGLMIYQEDVSRVAVTLAGFSHERADGLRKVMSKKDKIRQLHDYEAEFHIGAEKRQIPTQTVREIWRMIMSFDGYSFCKPHSASYAKVSFQAAFLKSHYPAEFMAAVLANGGGYYSTFAYISEAKRLGVQIEPPCINHSQVTWTGKNGRIRTGLLAVQGLSVKSCTTILLARNQRPFSTMLDFLSRVHPNQSEARSLIHAGGLDCLSCSGNRTELLWDTAHYFYIKKNKKQATIPSLFPPTLPAPPQLKTPSFLKQRRREFKTLGFLTDCHPLSLCTPSGQQRIKAEQLLHYAGQQITLAGWLIAGKLVRTKKGDPMEFLSFEDETAAFETTFFPGAYRTYSPLLEKGRPYLIRGRVDVDFGAATVVVEEIKRLG